MSAGPAATRPPEVVSQPVIFPTHNHPYQPSGGFQIVTSDVRTRSDEDLKVRCM